MREAHYILMLYYEGGEMNNTGDSIRNKRLEKLGKSQE